MKDKREGEIIELHRCSFACPLCGGETQMCEESVGGHALKFVACKTGDLGQGDEHSPLHDKSCFMYLPPLSHKFPTQREAVSFFSAYCGAIVRTRDRENKSGWIVTDGSGMKFRCWGESGFDWADDRADAVRYARRCDAEEVHADDEDAWCIVQYNKDAKEPPVVNGVLMVEPGKVVISNAHGSMATYECHITTMVSHAGYAEEAAAAVPGWKTSEIKRDPVLGAGSHFYLTAHDQDYKSMEARMHGMAGALTQLGVPVVRTKIEAIVYDTRIKG